MSTEWLQKIPKESVVHKAYEFAEGAHASEKRLDGEPYFSHCLAVAKMVSDWNLGEAAVAAALLHDVVEDTSYSLKDIEKNFGLEIAFLVNGLTKLKSVSYSKNADTETLRRFIISFTKDLRVLIIKLADRFHNMETLASLPPERQKKFADETIEIYAPLAYRLGMQKLSGDLEDMAFPYIYPEEYAWLKNEIQSSYAERQEYSQKVVPIMERALQEHNINLIKIDSRAKRYYSLYKKLIRYDMDLSRIYDLVALRVVVKTIEDCYAALGVVHQIWQPVPNRFKDYIARPKPNGYRSLHTAVFGPENKIVEIQIRTGEMHEEDELGIAAHWAYQQIRNTDKRENWTGIKNEKEMVWMEQLRNWQNSFGDQKDFLESLKVDFFKDRIFVLTPENDIIDLPAGATPVDFAYRIHSDIGDECVGAKVNGKIETLDYELQTRDVVEIITQKNKKPSEDWLRFVKTSLARKQIKETLNAGNQRLKKKSPNQQQIEMEIANSDRPGYLKDVTAAFGEMKINIAYLQSRTDQRGVLSKVVVRIGLLPTEKIQKLLVRLKKIAGTREVNYKTSR